MILHNNPWTCSWSIVSFPSGTFAVLWCIFWFIFVSECPHEDSYIRPEELHYISTCLGSTSEVHTHKVPWKSILTSLPVWATIAAHFSENWGFYTLLTQLPTFLNGNSRILWYDRVSPALMYLGRKRLWWMNLTKRCCRWRVIWIASDLDTSDLKLDKTGFLAAIPYLAMSIIVQCGGQLADLLRSKWAIETTKVTIDWDLITVWKPRQR